MHGAGLLDRLVQHPVNYWGSLVVDVALAATLFALGWRALVASPVGAAAAVVAGLLLWTLIEYGLHRWLFHGPRSIARRGHARHHRYPEQRLSTPVFVIAALALGFWGALRWVVPLEIASLLVGGTYLGYIYFTLLHDACHHLGAEVPYFDRLRASHEAHHRRPLVNFGSTTLFWDRVFGTYQPPARPRR